jgi:hypothetical protein
METLRRPKCLPEAAFRRARPADAKLLAHTAERIAAKATLKTECAAVTGVALNAGNDRHRFVRDTLREAGIEPVAMEGFAVWVAKLKPMIQ